MSRDRIPERSTISRKSIEPVDYLLPSGATLTSITAFSHLNVYDPWDESATVYADEYGVVAGEISSYSEELRLAGTAFQNNALNWLAGANYEHDTTSNNAFTVDDGTTAVQDGFPVHNAKDLNANRMNTEAGFGNLEYNITDALSVQAGARYTHRSDDFSGCLSDAGDGEAANLFSFISSFATHTTQTIAPGSCVTLSNAFLPLPIVNLSLDESNVSYRAGLSYKVQPDVMLYANVTKGYKAGAFETLPALPKASLRRPPKSTYRPTMPALNRSSSNARSVWMERASTMATWTSS
jgi:iron complex outermembrane recepter protein